MYMDMQDGAVHRDEEVLEVCSDSEAPNAFQRDGPGRVSIKKGMSLQHSSAHNMFCQPSSIHTSRL